MALIPCRHCITVGLKMTSRWLITVFVNGLLFTTIISTQTNPKEEAKELNLDESESRRQLKFGGPSFFSHNPNRPIRDDSFEFDIQKPQQLFDAFEQSDPFKPPSVLQPADKLSDHIFRSPFFADADLSTWPVFPTVKPIYPRKLTGNPDVPDPLYYPSRNQEQNKPSHIANSYPTKDAQLPGFIPSIKYEEKYPISCPKIAGYESRCQPAKDCAVWYDLVLTTPGTACKLESNGHSGVCCPLLPPNSKF